MLPLAVIGQSAYRGIVVDSLTLSALPGAHVKIKNTTQGTLANELGVFLIRAKPADTLVISMIGYHPVELPLLFEESGILIRLPERVNLLNEVIITGTRITEITRSYRTPSRPLDAGPVANPFDYFSRWQREKRKLARLVEENNRTITYLQVVNDAVVRESIMEEHDLSEPEFYELLVKFNQQNSDVVYSTDRKQIIDSMKKFFYQATRQ